MRFLFIPHGRVCDNICSLHVDRQACSLLGISEVHEAAKHTHTNLERITPAPVPITLGQYFFATVGILGFVMLVSCASRNLLDLLPARATGFDQSVTKPRVSEVVNSSSAVRPYPGKVERLHTTGRSPIESVLERRSLNQLRRSSCSKEDISGGGGGKC